ncbi:hypothetical protein J7T55_012528 [Diaporthe amygdali]|uniref:uncharacterized protein n=1 Tax=Phomopsis amygdali TaxID=1214568 RepID=UPI0022FE1F7E|nr:uncharacterized protein J7T55_012528 [Diaporthe amygdali]KAJ0124055.1 hypothetical protein J7T55_012528 [Diaporthe amygdali]
MDHHDSPSLEDLSMPLNGDTYEEKAFLSPVRDYTARPRKWSRSQALHLTLDLFLLTVIGLLASSLWSEKSKAVQPRRILGEDMHGFIPKVLRNGYVFTSGDLHESSQYPQHSELGDVFTVAAPHQVHCLGAILADNGAVRNGLPPTADVEHIIHCFNYVRQTLMCFADATTEGHGYEDPDGPVIGVDHMCRDYHALRSWADEPSRVFPKNGTVQPY